ncbi:hypothetical protein LAZ67_3002849 [Cordylochernes scorpioides]|uniref:Reverse transcriptase domain-containing protein n=1 Tax=Cordylochernes scorpioides TaxID=51811 RepID=A0ABY6K822_9ARAC|nr:hypothetical protein LAZ67_3002849 [Cordylochernes scorpioides]
MVPTSTAFPKSTNLLSLSLRPIIAYHLSPAYPLAKYLSNYLSPLLNNNRSNLTVASTPTLIQEITGLHPPHNFTMCSFDVSSLYLSLLHHLIIDSLNQFLVSINTDPVTTNSITSLSQICLNMSTFTFDHIHFKQIRGSPMGSPLSSIAPELVMTRIDKWVCNLHCDDILFWRRYVDDILCICKTDQEETILSTLNSYNPNLSFTIEKEQGHIIPFLDILIIRTPASFHTTVYYKNSSTPTYTHFNSFCPIVHKINIVKTLTRRLHTHCSLPIFKTTEKARIISHLTAASYPLTFIIKHTYSPAPSNPPPVFRTTCMLPYSPLTVSISRLIRPFGIRTFFINTPSIHSLLRHPITKTGTHLSPLDSSGAVYSVSCEHCSATYCMMGGHWFPEVLGDVDRVLEIAVEAAHNYLGIKDSPTSHMVCLHKNSIPQHTVGHHQRLTELRTLIHQRNTPMDLLGASFDGVSIDDCILNARKAVEAFLATRRDLSLPSSFSLMNMSEVEEEDEEKPEEKAIETINPIQPSPQNPIKKKSLTPKTTGITSESRHTVEYPDSPSAMRPVPHSDILPLPQPPENVIFSDDDSDRREQQSDDTNFEAGSSSEPHLLTQGDLNDLRQDEFQYLFSQENDLVYCNVVVSLMEALCHDHDTEEWRLFVDSSKISLKAVLLHNGNKFPLVLIADASNMKETYENMKLLLKKIEYERYGHKNILNSPLIDSENIYLPPLHIKLGLMKNFVKAMDRKASGFAYLKQKCSSISDAKIKEGIFVGPQIRELLQDGNF